MAYEYVFFLNDGKLIRSRDEAMFVYDPPNDDRVGARKRLLDELRSLSAKLSK